MPVRIAGMPGDPNSTWGIICPYGVVDEGVAPIICLFTFRFFFFLIFCQVAVSTQELCDIRRRT